MFDDSQGAADKKQLIMRVAAHLFTQKGFDGVSVREIAEHAEVTKPAIYYYFENKNDLYQQLLTEAFAHVANLHEEIFQSDLDIRDKLRELINGHFRFCRENPDVVKLLFDAMRERISDKTFNREEEQFPSGMRFRRISEFIAEGQSQGVFRSSIDPLKVGMMFIGTTNMFILYQLHSSKDVISDRVAEELVDIFLHGIEKSDNLESDQKEEA